MVWVVIGRRTKTERVPGGLAVERDCPSCGEHATFYERRAVRTLRLYFLDVFDYDRQRVMACGACGTLYATEEHGPPSSEDAAGWKDALERAGESVGGAAKRATDALGPAWQSAAENARGALGDAGENLGPMARRASANVRELFGEASESLGPLAKKASEGIGAAFGSLSDELRRLGGDPDDEEDRDARDDDASESARETDPEKAELLRRFEALERKLAGEGPERDDAQGED